MTQISQDRAAAQYESAVWAEEAPLVPLLKNAAAAMRVALEAKLSPLHLSVLQYTCLDLLARHPGASSADLARGAFVTRQSIHLVLRELKRRGLVATVRIAARGRGLSFGLTPAGYEELRAAEAMVKRVEQRMLVPLTPRETQRFRDYLSLCTGALADSWA